MSEAKSSLKSSSDLHALRHSAAHIMASAVKELFPDVKLGIGPAIEDGFYYDFYCGKPFAPEDLQAIEAKMKDIIAQNMPFARCEQPRGEAEKTLTAAGETLKLEILREIPHGESISFYQHGGFSDLCRGPHVNSTGDVKAFKLLTVSGAYWRGDEKRESMQRIYGTAFHTKEELDDYLRKLEEAAKRDHRKLGKELELFHIYEEGGAGLVFWHPKGAVLRHTIEDFLWKELTHAGYEFVNTPHIAKLNLWQTSGHTEFYSENMFSPIEVESQMYQLKPMNCPFHIIIYKSKKRSYRDLPMRYAEFGTVYRYERSGVLHGLLRVRGFTQDDAHIFCTQEQLKKELTDCVRLTRKILNIFGFENANYYLATRPEGFAGTGAEWDIAENTMKEVLEEEKIPYEADKGGAVFYGPKIDIKLLDALGREWQGPTVQFDFNLPKRFDVTYVGSDNNEHQAFMVHRALLGSFERFLGTLIEHHAGAFPVWLAPVQVKLLSVADRHIPAVEKMKEHLVSEGIRCEADARSERLPLKIREATMQKIPYVVVMGDKEAQENTLAVRARGEKNQAVMTADAFAAQIKEQIKNYK